MKINEYTNSNGPNDGGNDIRVFVDGAKLKVAFQVTIQESKLEKKINDDLKKTKKNVDDYNYQKSLFFFYSKPISEEKSNEFELLAETKYGIKLYLIDAKKIAFTAAKYPGLLKEINKQYGIEYSDKKTFSETDKMLYDFYSFGSCAVEIKGQIVKSFIVHTLYQQTHLKRDDLFKMFSEHFKKEDKYLFDKTLIQLTNEDKIVEKNQALSLTQSEEERIDVLKEEFNFQEHNFQEELIETLKKFNIPSTLIDSIIENLKQLYESNFKADKLDILDNLADIESDPVAESITTFYKFVKTIAPENKAKYITKDLIKISQHNDIIQKLSAGKVFTSFVDPNVVRNYLNQTERLVFIDTSIALYLLCNYTKNVNNFNHYYDSVKDLLKLKNANKGLVFYLYRNYIPEVQYHLREALMLVDYDDIDAIDTLGGTDNVLYNYFSFLKKTDMAEDENFANFLRNSFELTQDDIHAPYFVEKVNGQIKEALSSFGISIFEKPIQKDNYLLSVQCIEESLEEKERFRGHDNISNDAYMLSTLFEEKISLNEPIFVTWDLALLTARKKYHQKIPSSRLWHWFTPDRLYNHFSLLNFDLNSETITRDILSVIDDKFSFHKKTQTIVDALAKLVNIKTESGRKFVGAIKDFKKEYIYETEVKRTPEHVEEEKKTYPIEDVMFSFLQYYQKNKEGVTIEDFKLVFHDKKLIDNVIDLFKQVLQFYKLNKKMSTDAFPKMNDIISNAKLNSLEISRKS